MLLFLFYNWGSKDVLPLIVVRGRRKGPNKCSKRNLMIMGPMNVWLSFKKEEKSYEPTHEQIINMKSQISTPQLL